MLPLPHLTPLRPLSLLLLALLAAHSATATAPAPASPDNVLLVTLDGLRWQEVFRGADDTLLNTEFGGIPETALAALRTSVLAPTPAERRQKLMPFLWGEIASRGQIIGNRDRDSLMNVANAEWFSYPGYNELLTGFADPLITSNAPVPNRNVTVLEWLNQRAPFAGRVAGCATWHVMPAIINVGRSRLPVWVSTQNPALAAASPRFAEIDRWMQDIPLKARDEHYDAFAFHAALELIASRSPRVLYVALGEPDTNAHSRRYDAYLASITRCDRFIRELWERLQSLEQYRGKTSLLVTTDHGRGMTPKDWTQHNKTTPGSSETWLAALGPRVPPRGERTAHPPVISAQVAATLAALLGEDFRADYPRAAPPLDEILSR